MVIGTLCLLLITILIGKEINGSRNWINLGIFSVQSSEFLKLASIFYLSYIINQRVRSHKDYQLKHMLPPLAILGIGFACVDARRSRRNFTNSSYYWLYINILRYKIKLNFKLWNYTRAISYLWNLYTDF